MKIEIDILPAVIISIFVLIGVISLGVIIVKRKAINDSLGKIKSNAYIIVNTCTIILFLLAF
jgi:hypothetical protein